MNLQGIHMVFKGTSLRGGDPHYRTVDMCELWEGLLRAVQVYCQCQAKTLKRARAKSKFVLLPHACPPSVRDIKNH